MSTAYRNSIVILAAILCRLSLCCQPAVAEPPRSWTNGLGIRLVELEPGEFTLGEADATKVSANHRTSMPIGQGFDVDRPAIPVRITRGFAIAAHEVTVGQFRVFAEETSYQTEAERNGRGAYDLDPEARSEVDRWVPRVERSWRDPGFVQHEHHPVVNVTWHDAQAFCKWLSGREGKAYRLPFEVEWEYACRAGTSTIYSCGDDPDALVRHGNTGDAALERALPGTVARQRADRLGPDDGDGFAYTAPVGRYQPNAWGLFDMHGNAWEWCQDRFQDRYYAALNQQVQALRRDRQPVVIVDPHGPDTTPQHAFGDWRSIRGGSWYVSPIGCRAASRSFAEAGDSFPYTGFRVVCDLPAAAQ